jgi:biotin transporter BioY
MFSVSAGHTFAAALLTVSGIMITTVALNAYNLDSYPEASGEVSSWINFCRTTGGFIISYFQVSWANSKGTKESFGTQAAICVAAFVIVVLVIVFGKKMRLWAGPLKFTTS